MISSILFYSLEGYNLGTRLALSLIVGLFAYFATFYYLPKYIDIPYLNYLPYLSILDIVSMIIIYKVGNKKQVESRRF